MDIFIFVEKKISGPNMDGSNKEQFE